MTARPRFTRRNIVDKRKGPLSGWVEKSLAVNLLGQFLFIYVILYKGKILFRVFRQLVKVGVNSVFHFSKISLPT